MQETNTKKSFKDKWYKNKDFLFESTLTEGSEIQNWILNRNGWDDLKDLSIFLKNKTRILDAGCGNGRVTKLLRNSSSESTEVVGIDLVSHMVAVSNLSNDHNVFFYEKDLLSDLTSLGTFDFIYSQEVLHHTKEPKDAFFNLVKLLNIGGEIAIYVYKKKAPIREFTDDYVREHIIDYDYDKAMKISRDITKLGKVLSELHLSVNIPEITELGIKAGSYDIQRFFYHHFMKCYWNNELTFEENTVINYDWYHPEDCSRHTIDEIKNWFEEQNITIIYSYEDFYGITMHGKKNE